MYALQREFEFMCVKIAYGFFFVVSVADISEVDMNFIRDECTSVYRKSHNSQPCTMVSYCSVLGHTSAMSAPINICFRFTFQRGPFYPQIDQNYIVYHRLDG